METPQPCHLCEVQVAGVSQDFDFGLFTQPWPGRDELSWQVAYEEQLISRSQSQSTYVFFFHYLDFSQPMLSPFGPLELPKPTPRPVRLDFVIYEPPD
ncbi:MAG: hypothetical protein R3E96_02055 [Planctomycetota bacterium]